MVKALIIVDPQNDFCEGGPLGVKGSQDIFPVINKIRIDIAFDFVFITLDWHQSDHTSFAINHNELPFSMKTINGIDNILWPVHCLQNSQGANTSKLLVTKNSDIYIKKGIIKDQEQYSGFGTENNPTQLETRLKALSVDQVVVVGLALDYCVGSTALDAKKAGFQVTVVSQATKPVAEETAQEMINKFKINGVKYQSVRDLSL